MLVIRMQRTGRSGHAMFRVVVQDSRRTPTSGKIVANIGNYDPHSKAVSLNKEKVQFYLDHGAQPSERVARLLKLEGIKLPKWVQKAGKKQAKLRNPEKLRRNRPKPEEAPADEPATEAPEVVEPIEAPSDDAPAETPAAEAATEAEASAETPAEQPAPEPPAEAPAESDQKAAQ